MCPETRRKDRAYNALCDSIGGACGVRNPPRPRRYARRCRWEDHVLRDRGAEGWILDAHKLPGHSMLAN